VELIEIVKNDNGTIDHIKVKAIADHKEKLKGYIHWVSKEHSRDAIVRIYNHLFTVPEPGDDWL